MKGKTKVVTTTPPVLKYFQTTLKCEKIEQFSIVKSYKNFVLFID